jgi:hypothetical protein
VHSHHETPWRLFLIDGRLNPVVDLNDRRQISRTIRHLQAVAEHIEKLQKHPTGVGFKGLQLLPVVKAASQDLGQNPWEPGTALTASPYIKNIESTLTIYF